MKLLKIMSHSFFWHIGNALILTEIIVDLKSSATIDHADCRVMCGWIIEIEVYKNKLYVKQLTVNDHIYTCMGILQPVLAIYCVQFHNNNSRKIPGT